MAETIKLEKDGQTREVSTPAEQVRLEWNGWKVVTGTKKTKAASGGGGDDK